MRAEPVEVRGRWPFDRLRAHRASLWAQGAMPAGGVDAVVAGPAALADLQRAERVHHDGQLVEVLLADRLLGRARLRSVGVSARVQRDRPELDAGPLAGLV